jgi:putative ABC transport system permease protein
MAPLCEPGSNSRKLGRRRRLCIAAWCAKFVSGMLYNVPANDATALSAAVGTMLSVALLASAVPAIRATRIDPMRALREE